MTGHIGEKSYQCKQCDKVSVEKGISQDRWPPTQGREIIYVICVVRVCSKVISYPIGNVDHPHM